MVLALPRGGVPVAAEIAAALEAPLDLVLVRKIGVPFQPESAMGAVVDGAAPVTVRNEDVITLTHIGEPRIRPRCATASSPRSSAGASSISAAGRTRRWRTTRSSSSTTASPPAPPPAPRSRAMRQHKPRRWSWRCRWRRPRACASLRGEADDVVCLEDYEDFGAIGYFYSDFRQVPDDDVIGLLARHPVKAQPS